jgi:glycosyltransferase involved in cell wall biosynthesis
VLYISYDGLTDPLGQSQILPYLVELSKYNFRFTILSFEKKDRFQREKKTVKVITDVAHIDWLPLRFSSRPPIFSKIYDRWKLRRTALKLHRRQKFDMVHCRSYVAAEVGLLFKKRFGTKFLFDMRGFWADEKKEGTWNISNPVYRSIYNYYKRKESQYLQKADYIISLTEAGKNEMIRWASYDPLIPIAVIPTCADMNIFNLTSDEEKKNSRQKLGIQNGALVVSYLGSIGTWYMLKEMLLLFKELKKVYEDAIFLFVTHTKKYFIDREIKTLGLNALDFIILEASRKEVPFFIKASDINVSFIKPVYSKISSSPTKFAEVLAMGIPVICNSGVGDIEKIVRDTECGFIIENFKEEDFKKAMQAIPLLLQKSPLSIRNAVKDNFSLEKGVQSYLFCYRSIFRNNI